MIRDRLDPLVVRTVTAVYPGPTRPRRGHFIEGLHRALGPGYLSEILAPRIFPGDPWVEQRAGLAVHRFAYAGRGLPKQHPPGPWAVLRTLCSADRTARQVWPAADRVRGGVVLAHWVLPSGLTAACSARRLGVPLVVYAHGSDLRRYAQRWPGRALARRVLARAARVIAASEELRTAAIRLAPILRDRCSVVPVGVEAVFAPASELPPPPPPVRLLFVGDLIPDKGLVELLAALPPLRATGISTVLEVLGEGPLASLLVDQSADGVHWQPQAGPEEVRAAMARSHLLVLPSRGEGTPLVLQEALCCALPVAATPVGGVAALFAGRAGCFELTREDPTLALVGLVTRFAREGFEGVHQRRRAMEDNEVQSLSLATTAARVQAVLREVAGTPA